jgi:hypothetical protein
MSLAGMSAGLLLATRMLSGTARSVPRAENGPAKPGDAALR